MISSLSDMCSTKHCQRLPGSLGSRRLLGGELNACNHLQQKKMRSPANEELIVIGVR
jgi:hypothetical protein